MGAVLWRWRQVAGVSPTMSGLEPRQKTCGTCAGQSGSGRVFTGYFILSPATIIPRCFIFSVLLTCILIYPYNMNKQDELFSINLFQYSASTCFVQACCSSWGGSPLYKQQLVYNQSCAMLTGCWQQPVNTTHDYTNCCLYRVDPPHDEQQACSKHVEAEYWNKLIENSSSCWFMLYGWFNHVADAVWY